jgi:hypothetical protein
MTTKDRTQLDRLKGMCLSLTEKVCQVEQFIAADEPLPPYMAENACLTATTLAVELGELVRRYRHYKVTNDH